MPISLHITRIDLPKGDSVHILYDWLAAWPGKYSVVKANELRACDIRSGLKWLEALSLAEEWAAAPGSSSEPSL